MWLLKRYGLLFFTGISCFAGSAEPPASRAVGC